MIVGLDVGYSTTKAIGGDDLRVIFPSVVGTPDKARFSLGTDQTIVLVSPEHVQVGDGAVSQKHAGVLEVR